MGDTRDASLSGSDIEGSSGACEDTAFMCPGTLQSCWHHGPDHISSLVAIMDFLARAMADRKSMFIDPAHLSGAIPCGRDC